MKKHNRKFKALYAAYIAILTMAVSSISASAALDVSNIINFGNGIIDALKSIAVIICIGAMIVLGIGCVVAGRGAAEKLKSGFFGILVGIILISMGGALVLGLFSDSGSPAAVAQIVSSNI